MGIHNSFHLSGLLSFTSLMVANIKLKHMKTLPLKFKNKNKNMQILTILYGSVPNDASSWKQLTKRNQLKALVRTKL